MNKDVYANLAEVLVHIGANVQPAETVILQAGALPPDLIQAVVSSAYLAGAKYVQVEYFDPTLDLIRAAVGEESFLDYYPGWQAEYLAARGRDDICFISLHPPFLTDSPSYDLDRFIRVEKANALLRKGFLASSAGGRISSVSTPIPNINWAERVYPELKGQEALAALWEDFIAICRLDKEDPLAAWKEHQELIGEKKAVLDNLELSALRFQGPRTDLTLGLVEGGKWIGGYDVNQRTATRYVPNIPTEEVFFVPHKYKVWGRVTSTLPLVYRGGLIEGIELEIEEGRVISHRASKGAELLRSIVENDAGSCYFGEIALVSADSPIYKTGRVFYNTIFDENAACHLAFGRAPGGIIPGGHLFTGDEKEARGINDSNLHVDFMIGSEEMNVEGRSATGAWVPLLKNGRWVI